MTTWPMIRLWGAVFLMFAAATCVQVSMYARPIWGGQPIWGSGSPFGQVGGHVYTTLVVIFFCGPGLVAGGVALRMLYRSYARLDRTLPKVVVLVVIVLAILSCYAGIMVSFNTWGT